jgi:hypothetical protein
MDMQRGNAPKETSRPGTIPVAARAPQHLPSPDAHARVLIRVYGHHRAFRIAQRNSRLMAPEAYWADVRDTVLRLEPRH